MQHGEHCFKGALARAGVDVGGNATTVISDAGGAVLAQHDLNLGAVASQSLIDRIVHHLIDQVMQSPRPGGADVHPRTLTDGFETLQHLNLFGAIGRLYFRGFAHAIWIVQASCQAESTTGLPEALAEASETSFFQGVHPLSRSMSDLSPSAAPGSTQLPPLVVVLLGPTASGKTALALELAERFELEILNIDSRQLYTGMDVGTAKPTPEQRARVPHHLLDLRAPDQPITLREFQEEALTAINRCLEQRGAAFLVGGSGLYLKALTAGLQPPSVAPQPALRQQLTTIGQEACHQLLVDADPESGRKIAAADAVRTQRALEVLYATGRPMSSQTSASPPPWRVLELGLNPANLRQRINQRTQLLYEQGLIEETQKLKQQFGADLPMLQTIGYGEALQVLEGQLDRASATSSTTKRTQQFAKRQRTWFRRQHQPHWLSDIDPFNEASQQIEAGLG